MVYLIGYLEAKKETLTMETNIYREKLLNAVLYFAKNTKHLNTTKLSKLLYFLDFTHFKQTGYPSLGLRYYSFKQGPVPKDFWLEVKDGNVPQDFEGKLALIIKASEIDMSSKEIGFKARTSPDLSVFTPREIQIMDNLAFMFKDLRAWEMSEISHLKNQPWDVTIKAKGQNCLIDYTLAIDKESPVDLEDAKESLEEYFEVINNLHLEPTKIT